MNHALPLLTALLLAPLAALHAAEPWWHEYTPVATVGLRAESLETIQPGAARGVGTLGWYGFWFLDAQEQAGYCEASTGKLRQAGVKRIEPCSPEVAQRHSGYLIGGTSPFGTRKPMPVYVERTILDLPKIYINGGRRGFLVGIDPKALARVLNVTPVAASLVG